MSGRWWWTWFLHFSCTSLCRTNSNPCIHKIDINKIGSISLKTWILLRKKESLRRLNWIHVSLLCCSTWKRIARTYMFIGILSFLFLGLYCTFDRWRGQRRLDTVQCVGRQAERDRSGAGRTTRLAGRSWWRWRRWSQGGTTVGRWRTWARSRHHSSSHCQIAQCSAPPC